MEVKELECDPELMERPELVWDGQIKPPPSPPGVSIPVLEIGCLEAELVTKA